MTRASNVNSECGIGISYVDIDAKPWTLVKIPLTLLPTSGGHTAKTVRDLTTTELQRFGLQWSNLYAGVSDNASAAFNVVNDCGTDPDIGRDCTTNFRSEDGISRGFTVHALGCVCHVLNLPKETRH